MKELFSLVFPTSHSDEEKNLRHMQERMAKLKRVLMLRAGPVVNRESADDKKKVAKRSFELALKTEEVRKKIATGVITVKKADEKHTFKRAKARMRSSESQGEPGELLSPTLLSPTLNSPPLSESEWGSPPPTQSSSQEGKGKTLYIRGYDLRADTLEHFFKKFGEIERTTVDDRQKSAFMTFKNTDGLDEAIKEMNGNMVNGVTVRVSYARRQTATTMPIRNFTPNWNTVRKGRTNNDNKEKTKRSLPKSRMKENSNKEPNAARGRTEETPIPKLIFKFGSSYDSSKSKKAGHDSPEEGEVEDEDVPGPSKREANAPRRSMVNYDDDLF